VFVLEVSRFLLTIGVLGYCAIKDLKTREVSNKVWLLAVPIGLTLSLIQFLLTPNLLFVYFITVLFSCLLALGAFYLGCFGGADAKAIIFLAVTLPFYPQFLPSPFFGLSPLGRFCLPLALLVTSLLAELLFACYLFLLNIKDLLTGKKLFKDLKGAPPLKKLALLFSGRYFSREELEHKKFWLPLEQVDTDGQIQITLLPNYEFCEIELEKLKKKLSHIWVTPGLPLLVFMFLGIFLLIFLGDPFKFFIDILM